MRKSALFFILVTIVAFAAHAQPLANTSWRAYDFSNTPGFFLHFGADTVSLSTNDVSYIPVSTYATNTNVFLITDISAASCGATYTGAYNFTIVGDSLAFSYVNDTCSARYTNLLTNYFLRNTAGIGDLNSVSAAIISPNPSPEGIFNLSFNENNNLPKRIYVLNVDGRKIFEENFLSTEKNHLINLRSCAAGVYFLVMENNLGRKMLKLVR